MTEKNPSGSFKEYGITCTIKKPLESTHNPKSQYYYTRLMYSKIFGESCIDFRLMPEFTVAGRIHYHGILKIKNFAKWVKGTLPRLRMLGYVKTETFKNDDNTKWVAYMYKGTEITKDILGFKNDIKIEVTMQDYKDYKKKDPTIETFIGKPKVIEMAEIHTNPNVHPVARYPHPRQITDVTWDERRQVYLTTVRDNSECSDSES